MEFLLRMPEGRHQLSDQTRTDFERILRELEGPLELAAKRLCRNQADAKDLVQDTLERGLRNAETIEMDRNPRAWLTTIMHNLFVDRCRRDSKKQHSDTDILHIPQPEREPEPIWSRVTNEQVRRAVESLEPAFRNVYELSCYEGMSYAQIASELGIPKATVGTRLRRARQKLQQRIREESL